MEYRKQKHEGAFWQMLLFLAALVAAMIGHGSNADDLSDNVLYERMAVEDMTTALTIQNDNNAALIECQAANSRLQEKLSAAETKLHQADWRSRAKRVEN